MLFDTHTHAYYEPLKERESEVVAEMVRNNVSHAVQIGCDIQTSEQAIELAKRHACYYATVGYHPTEWQILGRAEIPGMVEELETMLIAYFDWVVAIGEIGFDYYHLDPERAEEQKETQRDLFFAMTKLAIKYELPVIIHTREARVDTLRYIKESGIKKVIIHCFSEDYEFARELMEYSDEIYFSFSGIVTYKKSLAVQEAAKRLPLSKILIETDAPFLSPQIVRGTVNESANVRHVLAMIQDLRSESADEIERAIYENSLRVYGI